MLKSHFKIAIRNLIKNKTYAFISIFGMAAGLAVCILLLLYVEQELSYDRFNQKADSLYRLVQPEHPYHGPQTAKLLTDKFPEIKDYTRILVRDKALITYREKRFIEKSFAYVDPSFFRMFSFKFKQGNRAKALEEPFTTVISEKIAKKYFGDENPIGKVIRVQNEYNYTITGVIEDMPQNSHFRYDFVLTLSSANTVFGKAWMNNRGWQNFLVYFEIPGQFNIKALEEKCSRLMKNPSNQASPLPKYIVQNIKDIHLFSSQIANDIENQNSITYVLIFSGIGFMILLIACFNYINLLTANATIRSKEIGIRKVVGASRKHLSMQFVGESLVVLFIALIIALVIVDAALPIFNSLAGKELGIASLLEIKTIFGILGIVVFTAVMAAFYPAFILSNIKTVNAFKVSKNKGENTFNVRKLLVVAQFVIVIVLTSCALFMFNQINYLQNKSLGFDKDYAIISEFDNESGGVQKYHALKQALLNESSVKFVSAASRVPSNSLSDKGTLLPEGKEKPTLLPIVHTYHDYFEVLGIKAKQGRLFSKDFKTDDEESIVMNEAAVKMLGLKGNPIGQMVACSWPKSNRKIIGIINDFNFESLYETIKPVVFVPDYQECYQLIIKVNPSNAKKTIENITAICNKFYPEIIFEFHFLDQQLESMYQTDNNTFKLMGYFTGLAILISCMGLFGLAIIMMKSRTKEIGVRKVLGASILNILTMLIKDFTTWIIVANIIAWPMTFYGINKWLQNFAYRIDITIWPFILSGIITFFIAFLTVGYLAIKAAGSNPIDSLRSE